MKLSELSTKDIINDSDGTKLGKIIDLELEIATGKITNIVIHRGFKFTNFFSAKDTVQVPWHKIIKIGSDVIIVESDMKKIKSKNETSNIENN